MLDGAEDVSKGSPEQPSLLKRALRIEWLGQMIASLAWVVSVFTYGISSVGDGLQLLAASSWFVANLAALANSKNS